MADIKAGFVVIDTEKLLYLIIEPYKTGGFSRDFKYRAKWTEDIDFATVVSALAELKSLDNRKELVEPRYVTLAVTEKRIVEIEV